MASLLPAGEVLSAIRRQIERRGEELVLSPDVPRPDLWQSPTRAELRYGSICIALTLHKVKTLVQVSGYRGCQKPGKRAYRRFFGIDVLGFLTDGQKREVRITQVLKGSRL